jgi:hypothetical protein
MFSYRLYSFSWRIQNERNMKAFILEFSLQILGNVEKVVEGLSTGFTLK